MNSWRAVGPRRRPIYRQISIARPAERDARGGGGGGEVTTTLSKERDKRRKEEKKASKEGSNNNDRRKKKTKKKKEKENLDHADCIVGCFRFLAIEHFAFQRMIQTCITPLVSKKIFIS